MGGHYKIPISLFNETNKSLVFQNFMEVDLA